MINAPFFDKQPTDKFTEIFCLIGSQAWGALSYNKQEKRANGQEWLLLCQATGKDPKNLPLVIGKDQLSQVNQLNLTQSQTMIRFCQVGELSEMQKTALLQNIAQNSPLETVIFADNLGQTIEDVSDYIHRLRTDESTQQLAKMATDKIAENEPKYSPYFEERNINGRKGLYYVIPKLDKEGEIIYEIEKWACDPLELKGEGYTESGEAFYIFEWLHPQTKKRHQEAISFANFGKTAGWEVMQRYGLKMTNESYLNKLADYFHFNGDHKTKWSVTEKTGWHNGAYLLPSGEIIGEPKNPVLFKNKSNGENGYTTKGTAESWKNEIAHYIRGNQSMMLAIAASFASPLLKILNADSFGVHLHHDSTAGKSTALNLANSIWGHRKTLEKSWDNTPVAIMNFAQSVNDGLLTLDELGQVQDVKDVENAAYKLFNETGRGRGQKDGGNQEVNKWKIIALSTGEYDLEGFLKSKGITPKAGQLVRLLNVPMIEAKELHGFTNNKAHADHLNAQTFEHYGVVGREWIKFIIANKAEIKAQYKAVEKLWLERLEHQNAQIQRVSSRFAILETALQLAKSFTGWSEEENREAILKSFLDWQEDFGTRSREETTVINQVNSWLFANLESRFIKCPAVGEYPQPTVYNAAGYRFIQDYGKYKKGQMFIIPKVFTDEVLAGRNKKVALKVLAEVKMLTPSGSKDLNNVYLHKTPSTIDPKRTRCYLVEQLDESTEDEPSE